MNFGEIRVFRFKRPECGAKAIPADIGIDASAEFIVVDEEMAVIIAVFGAHESYREILLSAMIKNQAFGHARSSKESLSGPSAGLLWHR